MKDLSREIGADLTHREIRSMLQTLAGREITIDLVAEEAFKQKALKEVKNKKKRAIERFNDIARGDFRIKGAMWEAKVHVNIARTGLRFWIQADEYRQSDREILDEDLPNESLIRAIAGRLRSAARLALDPIKKRCLELDAIADASAPDDELIYVKTAMRRLDLTTTVPAAILALIEDAHTHALARSKDLVKLSSNPYDLGTIVRIQNGGNRRRIVALLGPTNSGKTHAALELLRKAPSGAYLAPLRLMALEGWDRLRAYGLSVNMRTGEETIESEFARHTSATIEMADVETPVSVTVIDEAQLLDDPIRGWAWTRAICHAKSEIVAVTGSADCLPILRRIVGLTGESLEIHEFERRAPLIALQSPIELQDLAPGDALIAFSRANVLALKAELSRMNNPATGAPFEIATIYGALGPEVRRSEARRFASGEAHILIATDAIGMGLNLPIDRVIFSTLIKYDGRNVRDLTASEIRQIGGRAGRHGQKGGGYVGMLNGAGVSAAPIHRALQHAPSPPLDSRPHILPSFEQIQTGMRALELDALSKALPAVSAILRDCSDYRCQIDPGTIDLLETLEQSDLSIHDIYNWIGLPISLRNPENRKIVAEWASYQQHNLPVRAQYLEYEAGIEIDDHRLQQIERTVVQAGAYLWLSRRWPAIFEDGDVAAATRRHGNRMIEDALKQRQIHRTCRECGTPIGYRIRHDTCRKCAFG